MQGGTISFLVPVLAILNLPQWKCPSADKMSAMSTEERTELWQLRMREISGAIAVSAIFQLVIGNFRLCYKCMISKTSKIIHFPSGFTGFVGKLLKIITPLTIGNIRLVRIL